MTLSSHRGGMVIFFSIFIALVLAILPMPETLQSYRLQWLTLVLIYWCLAIPERVGVGVSFLAGIMLDIITGSLLGQHAMSLSVVAFITVKTHQRVRVFPPWQQALPRMPVSGSRLCWVASCGPGCSSSCVTSAAVFM